MKISSIETKLILGIVFISVFLFACISLIMISQEKVILEKQFEKQAVILAQALNASIGSEETLEDRTRLQNSIYKLMWLNPDIVRVDINSLTEDGLKIFASNDTNSIGKTPGEDSSSVLRTGKVITRNIKTGENRALMVTNPISLAGKTVGAYEITLSLEELDKDIADIYLRFPFILVSGIVALVLIMLLLFRYLIINPITRLKKAIKAFGAGDMSYRIKKISNDEIGEVAQGFNQMSKGLEKNYSQLEQLNEELKGAYNIAEEKVKERTKELEEARDSLEVRVKARTQELEELKSGLEEEVEVRTKEIKLKMEELERIQKVTTGRELRMIELKKEIKGLKNEPKKSKPKKPTSPSKKKAKEKEKKEWRPVRLPS